MTALTLWKSASNWLKGERHAHCLCTPAFSFPCTALDANSAVAVQTMRASSGELYVTVFGELEVVNALHLRVFRKELSGSQVQASLSTSRKICATGFFYCARFRSKSLNGPANCRDKPRLALGPALWTCCMLR